MRRLPIVTLIHPAHPDPGNFQARIRRAWFSGMLYINNGLVTEGYSDYILPAPTPWRRSDALGAALSGAVFDGEFI